jgi:hypothetical protein
VRRCGSDTPPFQYIGPYIDYTLGKLSQADKQIPIPINRPTMGSASASATATNFFTTAPDDNDEKIGTLLTPGNPPVTGSVSTRKVKADVAGAHSTAVSVKQVVARNL